MEWGNLPVDVVEEILSWVPPKQVWKLRGLSCSHLVLVSSPSFCGQNLRHFVPAPNPTVTESKTPNEWDSYYLNAPLPFQNSFVQWQWKHLTTFSWGKDSDDRYSPTDMTLQVGIPPSLLQLTSLQSLTLSSCSLTGPIPSTTPNYSSRLQLLDLSFNHLTDKIPHTLSSFHNLVSLTLDHNRFSGPIPPHLGQLSQLVHLSIRANPNLSGTLPREIGKLRKLEYLEVSESRVSGCVPREWGQLVNLKTLVLRNNGGMCGTIPCELGNLKEMVHLDMSGCNFCGSIPCDLAALLLLEKLYLWENALCGEVPVELQRLERLQQCVLSGNAGLVCLFRFREGVQVEI
ncbi:hypothetical protein HDU98_005339 [Podochytrium sp. JEL0797]|nr:hypothetical protein HDU98_005339 [Podochytrium sp. JEL0797]